MARMPQAEWQGEQSPGTLMVRYDVVCVHTIVGYAPAHAAHWSVHGTGKIDQSRDTRYRSAANLYGNHRVLAIENEDHGTPPFPAWGGSDVPALTPEQVESCAEILAWAHREHGIPLQLCPDSRPGSRGLAYHRQGCDGDYTDGYRGRVSGGELWSSSRGKVCPGRHRIAQVPAILARAIEIVNPVQEDDMPYTEKQLTGIVRAAVAAELAPMTGDLDRLRVQNERLRERVNTTGKTLRTKVANGRAEVRDLEEAVAELTAALAEDSDGAAEVSS